MASGFSDRGSKMESKVPCPSSKMRTGSIVGPLQSSSQPSFHRQPRLLSATGTMPASKKSSPKRTTTSQEKMGNVDDFDAITSGYSSEPTKPTIVKQQNYNATVLQGAQSSVSASTFYSELSEPDYVDLHGKAVAARWVDATFGNVQPGDRYESMSNQSLHLGSNTNGTHAQPRPAPHGASCHIAIHHVTYYVPTMLPQLLNNDYGIVQHITWGPAEVVDVTDQPRPALGYIVILATNTEARAGYFPAAYARPITYSAAHEAQIHPNSFIAASMNQRPLPPSEEQTLLKTATATAPLKIAHNTNGQPYIASMLSPQVPETMDVLHTYPAQQQSQKHSSNPPTHPRAPAQPKTHPPRSTLPKQRTTVAPSTRLPQPPPSNPLRPQAQRPQSLTLTPQRPTYTAPQTYQVPRPAFDPVSRPYTASANAQVIEWKPWSGEALEEAVRWRRRCDVFQAGGGAGDAWLVRSDILGVSRKR